MKKKGLDRKAYLAALCRTVPHHVVEAVLANPVEASIPYHSRFPGTVLFADLVGFTALCERVTLQGPEATGRLTTALNRMFARLLDEAVFPFQGYVIQFGGDSLTATFKGEGHALRAAAAARAAQQLMSEGLEDGLEGLLEPERRTLFLRQGVASGDVRLTVLGDAAQRAAVVAGPTAHRAVELQRLAQPGQIVVDDATAEVLGDLATLVRLPSGDALLEELAGTPPRVPLAPLADRLEDRVAEKIALLEPFVPPPLAARLKTTPLGWRVDGELRDVVVLFAEVEGLDAGEGNLELTAALARTFLRAFRKYGGISTKADIAERSHRMLVVFGLHMPSDNDVERALLAALEATSRFKGFAGADQTFPFTLRIGVHVGRVYFGAFGSDLRHDITVVGDAVNTAARVAAAAGPFQVVATAAAAARVGSDFEMSKRPGMVVRGKAEPITLHVVHAPSAIGARYVRARKAQRFYAGRGEETSRLLAAVERAWAGEGALLGLCGEAGTGKSAHLALVIDEWTRRGGVGIIGRCRYATRSSPLAPVVAMFESFLGLTPRDSPSERLVRIRQGFEGFSFEGGHELVNLLEPVRRPDGSTEAALDVGDPHAHERLLSAVLEFLGARMSQEPLLYVIEDVHHADALTLELVMRASGLARQGRALLVVTYRPDPVVTSLARTVGEQIVLRPLDAGGVEALVGRELGAERVDAKLLAFCLARTRGHPGHVVEIVRFLKEHALVAVRGGMALAPAGEGFLDDVVPSSLAHVALARMDELGEVERRLLRTASAIGQRFPRALLEAVSASELEPGMLVAAMANLEGERVLSADEGRHGYSFRDDITRAVAYGTIPEEKRRDVHRRIADVLETLDLDDPARAPAMLAAHRARAGQLGAAALEYEKAARLAVAAGLDEEAAALVDRWAAVVRDAPVPERPPPERAARMAVFKLVALGRRGVPRETVRQGRLVTAEHWEHLDEESRLHVDRWLGEALMWVGQADRGRERLERVFRAARDVGMRCDVALLLARSIELSGDVPSASRWIDEAAKLTDDDPYRAARVDLARAQLPEEAGELGKACALYERVLAFARPRRHLRLDAAATSGLAWSHLHTLRFDEAERGFREAAELYRALGTWGEVANAFANLGQTLVWRGRADEALAPLERALALALDVEDDVVVVEVKVHLGFARAVAHDPRGGRELLEEGERLALSARLREPSLVAALHRARLARIVGDDEARAAAVRDFEARAEGRMTPLLEKMLSEVR